MVTPHTGAYSLHKMSTPGQLDQYGHGAGRYVRVRSLYGDTASSSNGKGDPDVCRENKLLRSPCPFPTYLLKVREASAFIQDLGHIPGSDISDLVVIQAWRESTARVSHSVS